MGFFYERRKRMSSESAAKTKKTKKMKMPHIYVLLISITIICAAASWFLPAGEFERRLAMPEGKWWFPVHIM